MTVKDLIEALKNYDENKEVIMCPPGGLNICRIDSVVSCDEIPYRVNKSDIDKVAII